MTIEPRGVIDTNVVLLLPQLTDPSLLPEEPTITTVTLAELSVGPLVAVGSTERAARQAHLQQAESDFVPLAFDAAATAIANGLPLYTTNPSDFEAISGLDVRTVPHPEAAVSPLLEE